VSNQCLKAQKSYPNKQFPDHLNSGPQIRYWLSGIPGLWYYETSHENTSHRTIIVITKIQRSSELNT